MLPRPALSLVPLLALCTASLAQNPREPQVLGSFGAGVGSSVASAGDLSVLTYTDYGAQELYLRTSDGRGVTWSAPVRIDTLPGLTETLSGDSIAIVEDRVYVAYADERFGTKELFLRVYDATAGTLSPEVRVPNDYLPGEAATFGWDLEAEAGPGADRVYFVIVVDLPSPNIERARFVASHDGGATFPIERQLSLADVDAAYQIEVAAGVVHVAWSDNRHAPSGNDVFYQRSTDGGLTFLPADVMLDASGPGVGDAVGLGFHLVAAPPIVAVGWSEEIASILSPEIHAIVSLDQGLTFGPDQRVDQAPPGTQTGFARVAVVADPDAGSVAVGWDDTRLGVLGNTELFAATTFDGGVTWNEAQVSSGGILGVIPERGSVHAADGRTWMSFGYSGYYTGEVFSALSLDGGATWKPPLQVAGAPIAGSPAVGTFASNALYGNRIHTWPAGQLFGNLDLYVGGYRVPTLDFVESALPPGFRFELSEFGGAAFGAVLLSNAPGSLPVGFGDPRDLGLFPDALFLFSTGQIFGSLGTSLSGGSGATPLIPGTLPPGVSVRAAALSFDLTGGVSIGEISDVQVVP